MAQALVDGGVRVLEITLRTPVALKCMEAIAGAVRAPSSGPARSAASTTPGREKTPVRVRREPGYTGAIGQACRGFGLPLLPGVATGSEVMQANADGYYFLKFFPATAAGGIPMLQAMAGPFPT